MDCFGAELNLLTPVKYMMYVYGLQTWENQVAQTGEANI